jgi:alkaline phosphatase D
MKGVIIASAILLIVTAAFAVTGKSFKEKSIIKLAFGSCHSTRLKSPLWRHIIGRKPDVWIFGGDNMYADTLIIDPIHAIRTFSLPFVKATESQLVEAYRALHAEVGYKALLETGVEQVAIWDDHDYGISKIIR